MYGTLLALAREVAAEERLAALELLSAAERAELATQIDRAGVERDRLRELIDSAHNSVAA